MIYYLDTNSLLSWEFWNLVKSYEKFYERRKKIIIKVTWKIMLLPINCLFIGFVHEIMHTGSHIFFTHRLSAVSSTHFETPKDHHKWKNRKKMKELPSYLSNIGYGCCQGRAISKKKKYKKTCFGVRQRPVKILEPLHITHNTVFVSCLIK